MSDIARQEPDPWGGVTPAQVRDLLETLRDDLEALGHYAKHTSWADYARNDGRRARAMLERIPEPKGHDDD